MSMQEGDTWLVWRANDPGVRLLWVPLTDISYNHAQSRHAVYLVNNK
jgi:hypothetical protein